MLQIVAACGFAQSDTGDLTTVIKQFHQALVNKDARIISRHTDSGLSYGHSNGWIETKTDIVKDLETGYITYQDFKEDSLAITISGNVANARFVADVTATLNGKMLNNHLKVLEVWLKKDSSWMLFARQAVK